MSSEQKEKFDVKYLDSKDPYKQFESWYESAKSNPNIKEANVMCLATCSTDGQPSCRMISTIDFSPNGFLFFTNYKSKKGQELDANPKACMCFYWDQLSRQVVIYGNVKKISQQDSKEFFKRRPLESRINTLASEQGKVIKDKQELLEKKSQIKKDYETSQEIPLPENWGGYLFVPNEFDFWQGNVNDFDDRLRFRKRKDQENESLITRGEGDWVIERLCP